MIAGGEPVEIEETLELGGRSTVYRSVKFPLTDEAGEPYGVCGISTDITERKQTERALRDGAAAPRQRVRPRADRAWRWSAPTAASARSTPRCAS